MFGLALLLVVYVPMIGEAIRSSQNERRLRHAGAIEPADDVFARMQVVYPACFAAMIAEYAIRRAVVLPIAIAGGIVFVTAKALKYWAIRALGTRWTFRVLVPPGSTRVTRGPYRYLRHPNYVAVAAELAGVALLACAPVTGLASLVVFWRLMAARIRVEERALGLWRE